jgi:ATP-GRASP peptide maturase of grasp-with-spasm system
MILILSQASGEPTTEAVMDWLESLGASFFRLNGEDVDGDAGLRIELSGEQVEIAFENGETALPLEAVSAVWYRRWKHRERFAAAPLLPEGVPDPGRIAFKIVNNLGHEVWKVSDFLTSHLDGRPWLSHPRRDEPNKLRVLELARRHGLETPATLVTTSRRELERFAREHGRIITKCIGDADYFPVEDRVYMFYTAEVGPDDIAALPDRFFPSLFQAAVDKRYELRVFYLDGACHSMAIFSQLDAQTQVDFRRYNQKRPNRTVPYRLAPEVEEKIGLLMRDLGLETGSLDFLRAPDGRLVFLEVNPIGQFGMVSHPCNYFLERKVAEALIRRAGGGIS